MGTRCDQSPANNLDFRGSWLAQGLHALSVWLRSPGVWGPSEASRQLYKANVLGLGIDPPGAQAYGRTRPSYQQRNSRCDWMMMYIRMTIIVYRVSAELARTVPKVAGHPCTKHHILVQEQYRNCLHRCIRSRTIEMLVIHVVQIDFRMSGRSLLLYPLTWR
jgi:hypothetical protein